MRGCFRKRGRTALVLLSLAAAGCAASSYYRNPDMDFGSVQTVAITPLLNLTKEPMAAERVRDVLNTMLLATGAFYVVPPGEVAKQLQKVGVVDPTSPTADETLKLCQFLKADAVITGTLREYGEVHSGSAAANLISLSLNLAEAQTGRVVWSASSTQGGVGWLDRLFGGGGDPLNKVTEKAVNDLLNQLFGTPETAGGGASAEPQAKPEPAK